MDRRTSSAAWRWGPRVVVGLLLALTSGCGGRSKIVVHTFETPPTSWDVVHAAGGGELYSVRDHHLDLAGVRVFVEPTAFTSLSGSVDLAFLDSGSTRGRGSGRVGIAGVFLENESARRFFCFALRPRDRGQWRAYRAESPFEPRGGAGWRDRAGTGPTGFSRLEFETRGHSVVFRVDGREIAGGQLASSAQGSPSAWRVGIFSSGARTRWNNFVVGDNVDASFAPSSHVDWGDAATVVGLESEFRRQAKSFETRPSRGGVFALAAPLGGALEACRRNGDSDRYDALSSSAAGVAVGLRGAARRIGEEELFVKAFGSLARTSSERRTILGVADSEFTERATRAEAAGHSIEALVCYAAALEIESEASLESRFRALKSKIPTLSYSFVVDDSRARKKKLISTMKLHERVNAVYGGLPRGGGDHVLSVRLVIQKANVNTEKEDAVRRVSVAVGGAGMLEVERRELERLRSSRGDDLREAIANARVLEAGAELLGSRASERPGPFTLNGKTYRLAGSDGERLSKDYARYAELQAKWDRLAGRLRTEQVAAKRTTVSISFKARLDVMYDGRPIVSAEPFDEYLGLELWDHPALPDKGVERSKPSNAEFQLALVSVRARVFRRFDRLISTANVISKLEPDQRLAFLIGAARGARRPRDELSLRWALQKEFGIESVLRDAVARRLLD